jgi:hypothetical protein
MFAYVFVLFCCAIMAVDAASNLSPASFVGLRVAGFEIRHLSPAEMGYKGFVHQSWGAQQRFGDLFTGISLAV